MEKNPTLHATVPKAVPQKREVWDAETIFLALDVCDDAHLKLAINPSFACSMWIGEILGLTWDCVDISPKSIAAGTASIMIEKELQRVDKTAMKSLEQKDVLFLYPQSSKRNTSMLVLKKPKTESSIRRIFIPTTVVHQLKTWKREQERAKEALGGWVHRLQPDPRQWSGSSDETDAHHCTFERIVVVCLILHIVMYTVRLFSPHRGWIGALFRAQNRGQIQKIGCWPSINGLIFLAV